MLAGLIRSGGERRAEEFSFVEKYKHNKRAKKIKNQEEGCKYLSINLTFDSAIFIYVIVLNGADQAENRRDPK